MFYFKIENMKKIYFLFAGLLAVVASASAFSSARDIENTYVVEYEPCVVSPDGTPVYDDVTAKVEAEDETKVMISLSPWGESYSSMSLRPLVGTVDTGTQTLMLKVADNANLGVGNLSLSPDVYAEVSLFISKLDSESATWVDADTAIARVTTEGTIEFPEDVRILLGCRIDDKTSYLAAMENVKFVFPDYFTFNPSEWDYAGKSLFTEGVCTQLMKEDSNNDIVELDIYRNKSKKALYAVKNPYSTSAWLDLNKEPESEGYIVFSIENPDFVWMRPLTGSGLWLPMSEGGLPEEIYFQNIEGMRVFNDGMSVEEAADEFADRKLTPSKYDAAKHVVILQNINFATTENPFGTLMWNNVEDATYKFTIPETVGVDGIYNDADNVAKRYFNLQGVEVANPEAGQVIIVKEGNKVSKTVVRK